MKGLGNLSFKYLKGPFIKKGVPFVNVRYMKGVSFLPKMVYKRVRGRNSGGASPY